MRSLKPLNICNCCNYTRRCANPCPFGHIGTLSIRVIDSEIGTPITTHLPRGTGTNRSKGRGRAKSRPKPPMRF